MFIVSFKLNKYKVFTTLAILAIVIVLISVGHKMLESRKRIEDTPPPAPTATLNENETTSIVNYIEGFGWKVDPKPVETEEFQIPTTFDSVYKRYNEYQRDIGSDLNNYKGKIVKRYTFKVLNYKNPPQYEGQQVYADVIVYNGKVVAADLKTNQINGFMVSLKGRTFKEITGIDESIYR